MPQRLAHARPPASTDRRKARRRRDRAVCTASSISASVTINGGRKRTTLSPAPTVSRFCPRSAVDQIARRHHRLEADQQPFAANFGEHAWMAVDHRGELLFQQQRHLLHVLEEARLRASRPARHWRRRPRAGCRRRSSRASPASCRRQRRRLPDTRRSGKPPPSAFASDITSGVTPRRLWANRSPVRPMPVCTSSKISSRPLVVAELAQRLEEGMRRCAHAAFALQRLDQDAGGLRADRFLDGVEIAERRPDRSHPSAGRSLRDIWPSRWPPASPACGRGTRPRR